MKGSAKGVMRRALMSSAMVVAIAMPGAAFAQPAAVAGSDEQPMPTGEQSNPASGIQDIVVTARRSSESQQTVPISITTVTAETLRNLGGRDILDVQRVTPGLFIANVQTAGRARLSIRGQVEADDRLTGDRSVGVYIDGVSFAHTYGLTSALVDLSQIEVLRGPQGTLFGKNTTGGALNVTTQHPTYDWGGYVDLWYGSYNRMQGLAVLNAPLIDDRLSVRVVGQIISRDGYYTEAGGRESADDRSGYGRILLRADPADDVRIFLSADYTRVRNTQGHLALTDETLLLPANLTTLRAIATQLGLDANSAAARDIAYRSFRSFYDIQQVNPRIGFGSPRNFYDNLDNWSVAGTFEVDVGPVTLKSITSYRRLNRGNEADLDGTPFDLFYQRQQSRLNSFSQELQLSSVDGVGLDWQAGFYYDRENGTDFVGSDQFAYVSTARQAIVESDVVNSSRALYAQAVYAIAPNWRVTGGIRYTEDYREIFSRNRIDRSLAVPPVLPGGVSACAQLAPALGGPVFPNCGYRASSSTGSATWLISSDWRPVPEIMLYGSVARGYRGGGFTAPGTAVIPSQAALDAAFTPYSPENVTNYEIGFKSDLFDRRLRINGSFYYQDYNNIQVRLRDFVNGVLVTLVRNAASATIYGAELEVTAAPTDRLRFNATAGYTHAAYNEYFARNAAGVLVDLSSQAFQIPRWTASFAGSYELPLADGSLRFNANYALTDDIIYNPGAANEASVTQGTYGLLDARLNWNIASQGLDVAVFVRNLTDEVYYSTISVVGPFNIGVLGEPRTFGIQVRKTF